MSDAGIELEYEERLKAAARHLEIRVEFADGTKQTVRTFFDTPWGRNHAAKIADEWFELPKVERVEVVPVGASGHGAGGDPRTGPADEPDETALAPARATCCRRVVIAKPSGRRLCHSLTCPDSPGEPINVATYAKGREWPPVKP